MACICQELVGCCSTRPRHLNFGHHIHAHASSPRKLSLLPSADRSKVTMRLRPSLSRSNHQGRACSAAATSSNNSTTPGKLLLWSVPLPPAGWAGWAAFQRTLKVQNLVIPPLQQFMTGAAFGATRFTGTLVSISFVVLYIIDGYLPKPDDILDVRALPTLLGLAAVGGLAGGCAFSPEMIPILSAVPNACTVVTGCYVLVLVMANMASNLLAAAIKGVRKFVSGLTANRASHSKNAKASEWAEVFECASELNEFDQLLASSGQS